MWTNRGIEGLWLLTVFLVPLVFFSRDAALSEAAIAYVEVPKLTLLRVTVGLMAILWLAEWGLKQWFSSGPQTHIRDFRPSAWPVRLAAWLREQPTRWLVLAVLTGLLSACWGRKGRDAVSGAEQLYERAHKSLYGGNFANAIGYYENLEARYPFSNQARQGQLDLIYAYYRNRQPESVIDASRQFERENPTHPRVDYTIYMRGMALFSGEKGFFHRLFNVDLSMRPPGSLSARASGASDPASSGVPA